MDTKYRTPLRKKSTCRLNKPITVSNSERFIFLELTSDRVQNVKKFDNTGEDYKDLISIGTIGLIKAIESIQTGKGTKLARHYVARSIENEILMHLRSLKKTRKDILHDPIGVYWMTVRRKLLLVGLVFLSVHTLNTCGVPNIDGF